MNSTERKIAAAIAETEMPDDVRCALAERLADDLDDRASFSRTAWLLACSARDRAAEPSRVIDQEARGWLGLLAASALLHVRGRASTEDLESDLADFMRSEIVRGNPGLDDLFRSIWATPRHRSPSVRAPARSRKR